MSVTSIPTISGLVDQSFAVEPLSGPKDTFYYLETFPDEIYSKSPDTHLYKFMRLLLGEAGVGGLVKDLLNARLSVEELGVNTFDLDAFFGSPFAFGRIIDETLDLDPSGLIESAVWSTLKAKDARYRNRALDYMNGARAGNSPVGMRLTARAGLGHNVEIVENYRYLFDIHSDDPLGLDYYGKTLSTEEMIVLPRWEIGTSVSQVISLLGEPLAPNIGDFYIEYNGIKSNTYSYTYDDGTGPLTFLTIPFNGTSDHIRLALEALPGIDVGEVSVSGGPGPLSPWIISFEGDLSNLDIPNLQIVSNLGYATDPDDISTIQLDNPITITINSITGIKESVDDIVVLAEEDKYSFQQAIDRIRAQTTIPTIGQSAGKSVRTNWRSAYSSSEYSEVIRYVTGSSLVLWPPILSINWIESNVEHEAPRLNDDLQYHYSGFHNTASVEASSNFLTPAGPVNTAEALANYAEPLFITSTSTSAAFINGIYPVGYQGLPGVPPLRYSADDFWGSLERSGDESLTIKLPFVSAVNYISMDVGLQPLIVSIAYDAQDGLEDSEWIDVTPVEPYNNLLMPPITSTQNNWASVGLTFSNILGEIIFARALKITFSRQQSYAGMITVKNLRLARNI